MLSIEYRPFRYLALVLQCPFGKGDHTMHTDNRFSLIEVDAVPAIGQIRGESSAVDASTGGVDMAARARAAATDAVARSAGLAFNEPTFFAWGQQLMQVGKDKMRAARKERNDRPLASVALLDLVSRVQAEQRKPIKVDLRELTYLDNDAITRGQAQLGCSSHALSQLCRMIDAPAYTGSYLGNDTLPAPLRAAHMRHWLERSKRSERRDAQILTKRDAQGRSAYAIVSQSYVPHDLDAVAREIAAVMPSTARARITYDASDNSWCIDVCLGIEFEPTVGDLHVVGIRVRGSDDGTASISVERYAERVRCLNATIIPSSSRDRVRHVGRVADRVRDLIAQGGRVMDTFAAHWQAANVDALCAEANDDPREVARALVDAGHFAKVPGVGGDDYLVTQLVDAWYKEPGATRASWINAITRAAHEAAWTSSATANALETVAGKMLYQHVTITNL